MRAREAKKAAIQERWALGKLKKRLGKQSSRPDRKKTAGTRKMAPGNLGTKQHAGSPIWSAEGAQIISLEAFPPRR